MPDRSPLVNNAWDRQDNRRYDKKVYEAEVRMQPGDISKINDRNVAKRQCKQRQKYDVHVCIVPELRVKIQVAYVLFLEQVLYS